MKKDQTILSLDLYYKNLMEINGVRFTPREVDVISCILNRRGSSIAPFLSIGKRVVEGYISDIRKKAGGLAGREQIIDFIERSGKLSFIKNEYYSALRLRVFFEENLKESVKQVSATSSTCLLVYEKGKEYPKYLIPYLKEHLKRIGFEIKIHLNEDDKFFSQSNSLLNFNQINSILYVLPESFDSSSIMQIDPSHLSNVVFLLQQEVKHGDVFEKLKDVRYVDMLDKENYYFSFFEILKILLPDHGWEKIITDFKHQIEYTYDDEKNVCKKMPSNYDISNQKLIRNPDNIFNYLSKNKIWLLGAIMFIAVNSGIYIWNLPSPPPPPSITNISPLPENILLNRSKIVEEIDEKLKGKQGIQTVVLVGIGGAGKTTLARQYAHQQKANFIWEVNAETSENLRNSFEKLAQKLATTEEDKRELDVIKGIKDSEERQEKNLEFVKRHLRAYSKWLLIYDNAESFTADIQKYFPLNPNTWGHGKIIITTRNAIITNNGQVNHKIDIEKLTKTQKLDLFKKIRKHGSNHLPTSTDEQKMIKFLEHIPPFPLDISVAAYYINSTNISYEGYIENLEKYSEDFNAVQEDLLKEGLEYAKTRYSIIVHSLESLIQNNKEFEELLLFISLLDSQNIPRSLLCNHKTNAVLDSLISHLKKHSLIISEPSSSTEAMLSIHRSTQSITLAYLTKKLDLKNNKQIIEAISKTLEKYITDCIEKEDYAKMKVLTSHYEAFLKNGDLLNDDVKGLIGTAIGKIHYFLGNYNKAKNFLENGLKNLNNNEKNNLTKIAQNLVYQGNVHSVLGGYENAILYIERGFQIYKKCLPENSLEIAWASEQLGTVYRWLGNGKKAKELLETTLLIYRKHIPKTYLGIALISGQLGNAYRELAYFENARRVLEQSLVIYKKYFPDNKIRIAQTLTYQGIVEQEMGYYENSKNLIEHGLSIFKDHCADSHVDVVWAFVHLGMAHIYLQNYEKAKTILEDALLSCRKNFSEDHPMVYWISSLLGQAYTGLGEYEKAKRLLEKSLVGYEKYYEKDHIEYGRVLVIMGENALLGGDLELAEKHFQKTLEIFKNKNHPDSYTSLEGLAELYLRKSKAFATEGALQPSKDFMVKANTCLQQALEIVKTHFPENSPHIMRIQSKLKKLEQI